MSDLRNHLEWQQRVHHEFRVATLPLKHRKKSPDVRRSIDTLTTFQNPGFDNNSSSLAQLLVNLEPK